jgi:hypothetical protein
LSYLRRRPAGLEDDGREVRPAWHSDTQELTICACDQQRGAYFEFEPEASHALDAFYHPYSYASLSSVHYEDRRLAV